MHRLIILFGLLWVTACQSRDQEESTSTMKMNRVNHVGIVVKDLDKAVQFYEALTGVTTIHHDKLEGDRLAKLLGFDHYFVRYATLYLDNINIDLLEYEQPVPEQANYKASQISAMHLCFEVDDIDAIYERMKKANIQFQGQPATYTKADGLSEGAGTRVVSFTDPDGTNLQVIPPQGPFKRK